MPFSIKLPHALTSGFIQQMSTLLKHPLPRCLNACGCDPNEDFQARTTLIVDVILSVGTEISVVSTSNDFPRTGAQSLITKTLIRSRTVKKRTRFIRAC